MLYCSDIITTTPNSTSNESVFNIEDELKKISDFRLTLSDFEELSGNIIRWRFVKIFSEFLLEKSNRLIGREELRSALGFPPAGPWKHERKSTDDDSLEEYFESKVFDWMISLDSEWFYEKNFPPVISFLDKHLPAVRKIHRHVYAEEMRSYEGKLIDREAIDHMILKFQDVWMRIDPALRKMDFYSDWELEKQQILKDRS